MRIKLLYLWIVLMSIAACSREDVQQTTTLVDEDQYAVSLEEALKQLEIFLSEMSSDTKSTQSDKVYSLDNVLTVRKEDVFTSTKAKSLSTSMSLPDDLMYVVNFDNNSGTAILSADRRTEDIVLCVTDSGEITLSDFNAANEFLLSTTAETDNDDEDYIITDMGELIVPSLLLSSVVRCVESADRLQLIYDGDIGGTSYKSATKYGPYVETKWRQRLVNNEKVFNKYTPNNYPAGCVVIAVAQILLSTKGTDFNFEVSPGDTCYFQTMRTVCHYSAPEYAGTDSAKNQAGLFVYALGGSDYCKVSYGANGTSGTATGAKRALNAFNYNDVKKRTGFGSANQSRATEQIRKGLPVYLDGCKSLSFSGHAWVLDGEWGNYYHVNWGWGGSMDGYYTKGVFNTSKRAKTDSMDNNVTDTIDEIYNYTWMFRMVTYSL